MSVLITGAKGMLGHALAEVFSEEHDVLAWDQDELDITNERAVRSRLSELRPGVVINAAAYTNVDQAEQEEELANLVNGEAVGYLAQACAEIGATFVHYSTDYVFDGLNPRGYREDDAPGQPVNAYGRSKLLGEQMLLGIGTERLKSYLVRSSWLFGPHGRNFVDTMLELGREREEVNVVNDQHGKPTYAFDLAAATQELLWSEEEYEPGIYHITNETQEGGITWYDFAVEIFRLASMPVRVTPCASEEFPRPAKRPAFSVLLNTKLFRRRPFQEALADYLQQHALADQ